MGIISRGLVYNSFCRCVSLPFLFHNLSSRQIYPLYVQTSCPLVATPRCYPRTTLSPLHTACRHPILPCHHSILPVATPYCLVTTLYCCLCIALYQPHMHVVPTSKLTIRRLTEKEKKNKLSLTDWFIQPNSSLGGGLIGSSCTVQHCGV